MKLLVCGSRRWTDAARVDAWLRALLTAGDVVIHGWARGADTIAHVAAIRLGYEVRAYPAEWSRYGRAAGARRNQEMLDAETPELVLAFPGRVLERDTWDMIRRAMDRGIPVIRGDGGWPT